MKKYLFYDNLVRGAGIGHTLACYNFGLQESMAQKLIYLPLQMRAGHGLGHTGLMENLLGLPECALCRSNLQTLEPEAIQKIELSSDAPPTSADFSSTEKYFLDHYKYKRISAPSHLNKKKTNITISIRRGDIVRDAAHQFKDRLLPDSYYVAALEYAIDLYNLRDFHITIYSDADWGKGYVNEKGETASVDELFKKFKGTFAYIPGNSRNSPLNTLSTFQDCVDAEIFIGSISGFCQAISLYQRNGKLILPSHYKLPSYSSRKDQLRIFKFHEN